MFVVNVREGPTPWHYTLNPRFNNFGEGVLFQFFDQLLDALKYFGLYRFALRVGTDPVRTALAIHQYSEIDWTKIALQDGFVSYDCDSGEVYNLADEVVPAGKRGRGTSVASRYVTLTAIPVVYRDGVL